MAADAAARAAGGEAVKPLTKCQPYLWRELDGTPSIVVIDTESGSYYRASEADARFAELEAERDAARAVLAHVASIAHQGGLAGYDYHEALADIRALTIKNWNRTGTRADALERLNAAIDAARGAA